jgi:aldose 1-epimerase
MSVSAFGEIDGKKVQEIRLKTGSGAEASIISFGATLRDLQIPLKGGGKRRAVLGFEKLEGYLAGHSYMGSTCGRIGNRIAGGAFTLDGKNYDLARNEGDRTHLHGGTRGFSHLVWEVLDHKDDQVTLRHISPDGEEGYPGMVEALCTYRLKDHGTVEIVLNAKTDAPTLVNIVNHSYFTLLEDADNWGHQMEMAAPFYTPLDDALIPTGEIRSVSGTPFDFREKRPIGFLQDGKPFEYDINLVLDTLPPLGSPGDVAVRATASDGKMMLEMATTEPGVQLYTGGVLGPIAPGVGGQKHFPHAGFCLEAQRFPDAVHHRHFAQATLRPGERYQQVTEYRFKAL